MAKTYKLFRDPVHGNIQIENWMCEAFVDTDVFQRLRFIEQSSVRLLFPGARHDRFIHSIGVFHVAKKIFANLASQFSEAGIEEADIESLQRCFLTAALLHDCAHSPFSHTGEVLAAKYCDTDIKDRLVWAVGVESFKEDLVAAKGKLHTHELASAYVGVSVYKSQFEKWGIDKEQFARMIVGVINKTESANDLKGAYNCLIQLINGFIIDADRLDYLLRDTWATGICNATVDLDRLAAGLELDVKKGHVHFSAKVLPSVINAVSARDYIYTWVLPHHKVALANLLLDRAMTSLVLKLSECDHEEPQTDPQKKEVVIGSRLFSPDRLLRSSAVKIAGEYISLPSDGDLLYLMKKYIPDDKFVKAYLSREKSFISLWKTYAEFLQVFSVRNHGDQHYLQEKPFWDLLCVKVRNMEESYPLICTCVLAIKQTADSLSKIDVYGPQNDESIGRVRYDLSMLLPRSDAKKFYFYVYVKSSDIERKNEILQKLKETFEQVLEAYRHLQ